MALMKDLLKITTSSFDETMLLGEKLGLLLNGGEIIELSSDLGGGKTTLTKGIARGLGSNDLVSSPTFTISNVYSGSSLTIHHYDFYRLGELGLMSEELQETLNDPEAVSIIEWAGEAHKLLPTDKLIRIIIEPLATNEDARSFTFQAEQADIESRLMTLKEAV